MLRAGLTKIVCKSPTQQASCRVILMRPGHVARVRVWWRRLRGLKAQSRKRLDGIKFGHHRRLDRTQQSSESQLRGPLPTAAPLLFESTASAMVVIRHSCVEQPAGFGEFYRLAGRDGMFKATERLLWSSPAGFALHRAV